MNETAKEWIIVYGSDRGVEGQALKLIGETLWEATGRAPVCLPHDKADEKRKTANVILSGTADDNPLFTAYADARPVGAQGYRIFTADGGNVLCLEGSDPAGALYAAAEWRDHLLPEASETHTQRYFRPLFGGDPLPAIDVSYAPKLLTRGLWTWGHTICDYKGYLDNMVRLRLNALTVWNDFPVANAREVVAYAHERGIKVVWGFSWLWDTKMPDLSQENLTKEADRIAEKYEREYDGTGDGIYFQSFTETSQETLGGVLIADAVTRFVNDTAGRILARHPSLEIQFGLHASSVKKRLDYIRRTDPRIRIVWEDCGAFPYNYIPSRTEGMDETLALTEAMTTLRGGEEKYGAVLKGLTCLDWKNFRHQSGSFRMGEAPAGHIARGMENKRPIWRYVQAWWMQNIDAVPPVMERLSRGDSAVFALLEDGYFEAGLWFPAALMAEAMWDPSRTGGELLRRTAQIPDVIFA